MKLTQFSSILLLLGLILGGGAGLEAASPVYKTFFGSKAIGGYDAVAYHSSGKAIKGSKNHAYEWRGANWLFAAATNLTQFKANPEKYAPQFGGYCAWAVSEKNSLVKVDPRVFDLVDGKLYLNYNKKTQRDWRADRKAMIRRGALNYPSLIRD